MCGWPMDGAAGRTHVRGGTAGGQGNPPPRGDLNPRRGRHYPRSVRSSIITRSAPARGDAERVEQPRRGAPAPAGGSTTRRRRHRGGRGRGVRAGLAHGDPVVDTIERALLAASIAWIGSHGRRWAWLIAGVLITVPASGTSLLIALAGLAIVVATAIPKKRNRVLGALGIGVLVNAALWYPPSARPSAPPPRCWHPSSWWRPASTTCATASGARVCERGCGPLAPTWCWPPWRWWWPWRWRSPRSATEATPPRPRSSPPETARPRRQPTSSTMPATPSSRRPPTSMACSPRPATLIPGVAQQVEAVRVTVAEGRAITDAGDDIVASRLRVPPVRRPARPRPGRAAPGAHGGRQRLAAASRRAGGCAPGRGAAAPLRTQLETFSEQIEDAQRTTALAADLLEVTPGLFGADGQRRTS